MKLWNLSNLSSSTSRAYLLKFKDIISEKETHEKNIDEIMKNAPFFIEAFYEPKAESQST